MKLTDRQKRAVEAVAAGAVMHAHPFTWAVAADWLDVKPSDLQRAANKGAIKVEASASGYWRRVFVTEAGRAAMARSG